MDTCEFKFTSDKELYYIRLIFQKHDVEIVLSNGPTFWTGRYEESHMLAKAEEMHLPIDEYFNMTKKGFVEDYSAFQYKIDNSFSWSKIDSEGIVYKYGSIKIEKENGNGFVFLIESLDEKNKMLNRLSESHNRKIENLCKDLEATRELLESALSDKKHSESKLMAAYLNLLNSKKRKIRSLNEIIAKLSP